MIKYISIFIILFLSYTVSWGADTEEKINGNNQQNQSKSSIEDLQRNFIEDRDEILKDLLKETTLVENSIDSMCNNTSENPKICVSTYLKNRDQAFQEIWKGDFKEQIFNCRGTLDYIAMRDKDLDLEKLKAKTPTDETTTATNLDAEMMDDKLLESINESYIIRSIKNDLDLLEKLKADETTTATNLDAEMMDDKLLESLINGSYIIQSIKREIYERFCQKIEDYVSEAESISSHFTEPPPDNNQGEWVTSCREFIPREGVDPNYKSSKTTLAFFEDDKIVNTSTYYSDTNCTSPYAHFWSLNEFIFKKTPSEHESFSRIHIKHIDGRSHCQTQPQILSRKGNRIYFGKYQDPSSSCTEEPKELQDLKDSYTFNGSIYENIKDYIEKNRTIKVEFVLGH